MADNILSQDKDTLITIRDYVRDNSDDMVRIAGLKSEISDGEKELSSRKKAIKDEVTRTVKSRRADVAKTFDDEDAKLKKRLDEENKKRNESRSGQVSERIGNETEGLETDNETLRGEAKKLFKDTKTPSFYNSGFFYTLFAPRGFKEFLWCLFTFIIIYLFVPVGVYYFGVKARGNAKIMYLILIYLICIVVFGGFYLIVKSKAAGKYRDTVEKGKEYRAKIRGNNKQIKTISKGISKEKDDSAYNLASFDETIEKINRERDELAAKKKEALKNFDDVTKQEITDSINSRDAKAIAEAEETLKKKNEELTAKRDEVKQQNLYISQNYATYLGKELCDADKLNRLCQIMEEQNLSTINDAIAAYKKEQTQNG